MGRPKAKNPLNAQTSVNSTEEQKAAWEEAAEASDVEPVGNEKKLNAWIRHVLDEAASEQAQ